MPHEVAAVGGQGPTKSKGKERGTKGVRSCCFRARHALFPEQVFLSWCNGPQFREGASSQVKIASLLLLSVSTTSIISLVDDQCAGRRAVFAGTAPMRILRAGRIKPAFTNS